jgi:hypothetical protein
MHVTTKRKVLDRQRACAMHTQWLTHQFTVAHACKLVLMQRTTEKLAMGIQAD